MNKIKIKEMLSQTPDIRKINIKNLTDIDVDGIDPKDYPDFVDAFVASASYDGIDLNDKELDWLNSTHPEIARDIARKSGSPYGDYEPRDIDEKFLNEKAPPGFPKGLHDKLLSKYKEEPSKAYATMWKLYKKHGKKLESVISEVVKRILNKKSHL